MPVDVGHLPRTLDRWLMRAGLGLAAIGFLVVGVGGIVLAWDGGWFVLRTLETGTPTFLHGRVAAAVVQVPAILLGTLTRDAGVATATTGLAYAAVPILALGMSWRVTRPDRDDVLALAVVGIGLLSLPGRAALISEAMVCIDLAWPLLSLVALGRVRRHRLLTVALTVAVMLLHPIGVPVLASVAAVAVARAVVVDRAAGTLDTSVVTALVGVAVLAVVVALIRSMAFSSGYESSALDPARFLAHVRGSLGPRPLVAVGAGIVLAGCVVVGRVLAGRRRAVAARSPLAVGVVVAGLAVLAALVAMTGWAADPARWQRALQFRTLVLPVHVPAFALLAVLALTTRSRPLRGERIAPVAVAGVGLVVLVVLAAQTLAWRGLLDRTREALATRPAGCVELRDLPVRDTALDHWGTTSALLVAEAPAPRHLVLPDGACATGPAAGGIPVKVVDGVVVDRLTGGRALDLAALAASLGAAARGDL